MGKWFLKYFILHLQTHFTLTAFLKVDGTLDGRVGSAFKFPGWELTCIMGGEYIHLVTSLLHLSVALPKALRPDGPQKCFLAQLAILRLPALCSSL